MFIGHFGVGFAAKTVAKRPSLGTLFLAAQFLDLLWPILLILKIEKVELATGGSTLHTLDFIHYPFTHSLFAVVIWGCVFGLIYFLIKKNLKNAVWCGLLVISHWFLDLIVHRPDLPLFPGSNSPLFGLDLWNSVLGSVIVETTIFLVGIYFYLKTTRPKNKIGSISLWTLIFFLLLFYLLNVFGPAPDSVDSVGYVGLSQFLLIGWAYWIDNNRFVSSHSD